jgi:hypothetical protein
VRQPNLSRRPIGPHPSESHPGATKPTLCAVHNGDAMPRVDPRHPMKHSTREECIFDSFPRQAKIATARRHFWKPRSTLSLIGHPRHLDYCNPPPGTARSSILGRVPPLRSAYTCVQYGRTKDEEGPSRACLVINRSYHNLPYVDKVPYFLRTKFAARHQRPLP